MKVLHIISGGDSGGAKTHLFNLCSGSSPDFNNIIGCINEGALYRAAKIRGLDTVLFNQRFRADLGILKDINGFIRNNDIDIVNFHGARANFLYAFLKSSMSVPGVTTVHSDYRYDFQNNRLKYLIFTPLNALSLKYFDSFICVSRRIGHLLDEKGYKGPKYVVNNGIDPNITVKTGRQEIRKMYGIPEDAFVYTMVARLHPVKNHMGFVDAARMIIDEHKDVMLLIVGSGDMDHSIRQRVRELNIDDHVIFAGHQDRPVDYINAGDVNMLTSFNETFPLVILEGALVGKAAICSDVGDIRDILDDESGFIVDPHSEYDIYDKMKMAYENREMLNSMGQKLYSTVIEGYTLNKFREKYHHAYEKILSGEKNG